MVDSLMTSSENFLRHKSFSSKEGGYKIIINGLSVFTTNVILDYNHHNLLHQVQTVTAADAMGSGVLGAGCGE